VVCAWRRFLQLTQVPCGTRDSSAVLHWFYWEAYTTFLSGFFLLCLLYYGQAEVYLIDPTVAVLSKPAAIAIGVAFLIGGWLVYDGLCRSPLGRNGPALSCVLTVLLSAAAGRCAICSAGAAPTWSLARCSARSWWRTYSSSSFPASASSCAPNSRGASLMPSTESPASLRSTHNTYFTLPVLFVMISHHYAMTYGARENWLVLIAICAAGVSVRLYSSPVTSSRTLTAALRYYLPL